MFMLGALFLYLFLPMCLAFYTGAAGAAAGSYFGLLTGTLVGGGLHTLIAFSTWLTRKAYGGAGRAGYVFGVSFSSGAMAACAGSLAAFHWGLPAGILVGGFFGSASIIAVRLIVETLASRKVER